MLRPFVEIPKAIDWKSLTVAVGFGYVLSILPLLMYLMRDTISTMSPTSMHFVLFRAEAFLIFSIIAFSSVGNLLSNSDKVNFILVLACTSNIIFGLFMFGIYSAFPEFDENNVDVVANVINLGFWSWVVSFLIFSASHLKLRG